ncbi:tetratricopeptide repeat protein [Desulfosporosinus fructosivorans]
MIFGTDAHGSFELLIEQAVNALQAKDYPAAKEHLKYAMFENANANAPEVHNLYGVLAEFTGDLSLAGKHYRAAYALDPAYKPASRNLERITSFYYNPGDTNPDFGDKPDTEEIINYILEFDNRNIGHLRKRSQ